MLFVYLSFLSLSVFILFQSFYVFALFNHLLPCLYINWHHHHQENQLFLLHWKHQKKPVAGNFMRFQLNFNTKTLITARPRLLLHYNHLESSNESNNFQSFKQSSILIGILFWFGFYEIVCVLLSSNKIKRTQQMIFICFLLIKPAFISYWLWIWTGLSVSLFVTELVSSSTDFNQYVFIKIWFFPANCQWKW